MAQKLRALAVLAEKLLGLPEPTSGSSQASATPSLAPSSGLFRHLHSHVHAHTDIDAQIKTK